MMMRSCSGHNNSHKMALWMFLALLLVNCGFAVGQGKSESEHTLKELLMQNYKKEVLPDDHNSVTFRMTIMHFDMNEEHESIDIDTWVSFGWRDPRLMWWPGEYYNITKITLPAKQLWTPDVGLFNSAVPSKAMASDADMASISADGNVMIVPAVRFHGACVMDLTYWPYDKHNCTLTFGSWMHDGFDIDLIQMDDKPEWKLHVMKTGEGNMTRGEWEVLDSNMTRTVTTYENWDEPYVTLQVSILVQRDAPAFAWTIQLPAFGLMMVTFILFLLPPDAGEKIVLGGISLLLDVMFIAYTSQIVNHSPSHTPLIVKMIGEQLVLVLASLVVSAIVIRLSRDPHSSGLPICIKAPLVLFSTCLCIFNYRQLVATNRRKTYHNGNGNMKSEELELGMVNGMGSVDSYPIREATNRRKTYHNGNGNMKSEELELGMVNGMGSVDSYPIREATAMCEWLLLAAFIDRICLIVYLVLFIFNLIWFSTVL